MFVQTVVCGILATVIKEIKRNMIKVTDLMIGDYVTFADCIKNPPLILIKIEALGYQDGEGEDSSLVRIDNEKACDIIDIDDEIVGIPLTPEILERNGFAEDDNDDCWGDANCFFIPNYADKNIISWETHIEPTNGRGDFSGNLTYVHELQHALKLCGINKPIKLWDLKKQ